MNAPDSFVSAEMGPVSRAFADYAIEVRDDANAPRFEVGEKLYINSHRIAEVGDDVVIRSQAGDLIAQLIRRTEGKVVFRQYNRNGEVELKLSGIQSIGVVVLRMLGNS
jgi:phage repressor protein C with HTH and peptisase S24 domain